MNTYPSSISNLITVIGRGHGGTRAISHTLTASGVYMGANINGSGDLIPPDCLYNACRVISPYVRHLGGTRWDFSALHTMPIPDEFTRLVETYLASVLASDSPWRGWKLPETTLIFPWIVRMFPEIRYIYWVRDPRDAILSAHYTDDLGTFNIPYDRTENVRERRAISWAYQTALCRATPKPRHWISVRFEDFVLDQEAILRRL
ncbi:MAG TPA: sulfotransferase, partial [Candidatus Methylacidiphilales bacterium]|nr:sulfotransferase [Candidatus Methylacidiphilales bacterium]